MNHLEVVVTEMGKTDKQTKSRMVESAELAQALIRCPGLGIYIVQDGRFQYANSLFQELTCYTEQELRGIYSLDLVHPEDRETVREKAIENLKGNRVLPYEYRFIRKNGDVMWILERLASIRYRGKRAAVGSFMDITERKQAEEKMRHLNLVLRAIRNVNQLIARGADRDTLFKGVCENFVKTRGYHNAWIALLDESGKLVTAVEAGLGKDFLQMIERLKLGELPACGRKALEKSGVVVIEDPPSVCTDCPLAKGYSGRGGMAIRLEYGGKVYGLMTVSTPLSYLGQKEELDLFEEVAGDIAFALYSMEQEEERKKAEEALAGEAIRRRILIEQSSDGISVLDEDGKVYEANQRFAEMLGYSPEEVRELHMWDWDTQWTREQLLGMVRSVDEAGDHFETYHRRKDGTVFDVEISTNGAVVAGQKLVFCVSRDITERKQAEEALRRSEQNFRDSIENSPLGIRVLDKEGKTLYANRALLDFWGYSSVGEMEAVPAKQRYTPQAYAEHMVRFKERKRGEHAPLSYETSIVRGDGQVRILSMSRGELLWNGEKQFQIVSQDITEYKQLEAALAKSEERYRTVLEQMEEAYYETDIAGKFTFCNDAMCRQLGYSREELMGMSFKVITPPDDMKRIFGLYNQVYHTGEPLTSVTIGRIRKDGARISVESSIFPLRNGNGEITGFRGIAGDITERKRMEHNINERVKELSCLYDIAEIAESPDITLDEAWQEVGNLLLASWQYPEITCVRITINGSKFETENYRETEWKQSSDIRVHGAKAGIVEICYLEERPEIDEGPFLKEERKLIDTVCRQLGIIIERKRMEENIRHLAYFDEITDLPNRTLFNDRLKVALARAKRKKEKLAVMMLDLDKFKIVNDTLGHEAGDRLLQAVGNRLKGALRESDTVARIGGDEFVVLLPQIPHADEAAKFAQRILGTFRKPFVFNGYRPHVTISIGIAIYPEGGKDIESLLKNADTAMYLAKEQGRDIYRFYDGSETATLLAKRRTVCA